MKQQADSEIQTSEQPAGRPRVNPRVARDRVISANNEPWAVVPPKKAASKKRKALRIALIVAAVGAAAAGAAVGVALFCGKKSKDAAPNPYKVDLIDGYFGRPVEEEYNRGGMQ